MRFRKAFGEYHPIIQFVFFVLALVLTMSVFHPFFSGISLAASLLYVLTAGGLRMLKPLTALLPVSLLLAAVNPLFNHAGVTILFYLPDGNPFTLESLLYGVNAGVMLLSVMLWCIGLHLTLSGDRVIYLFGRAAPRLGLFLSMTLRFLPQLSRQFREIRAARHGIGRDLNQGSLPVRFRNAVRILSSLVGWTIETASETADSLRSRGYGLPHRTAYHLFRFEKRDGVVLTIMLLLGAAVGALFLTGQWSFDFYPMMTELTLKPALATGSLCEAALLLLPTVIGWKEERKWRSIHSGT